MSYQIHITSAAERNMNRAVDYIEFSLKNPKAADDLMDKAEQQINALSNLPQKQPLVDDKLLASWGVRFIQVNHFIVFYVISEEDAKVIVVRFLYAKSNWASLLKSGFSLI